MAHARWERTHGRNVPIEQKQAMIEALRHLPGVTVVGAINQAPLNGSLRGFPVYPPGTTVFTPREVVLHPDGYAISPGYLETAPVRLLEGREVSWHDTPATPWVALINRTCARQLWGGASALGQRFIFQDQLREVVGVVEEGKYEDATEAAHPAVFLPLSQDERRWPTIVLRTPLAPAKLVPEIERTLRALQPEAQVTVRSWNDTIAWNLFPTRAAAATLGIMSALAALLAATGIFGMAAYNVSRRMKELGLRAALGASAAQLLRTAVGRPIGLLAAGSTLGLLTCLLASCLLGQIVHQANARDPLVLLGAIAVMLLLGAAAAALLALAVDPSKLLREEQGRELAAATAGLPWRGWARAAAPTRNRLPQSDAPTSPTRNPQGWPTPLGELLFAGFPNS